MLIVFRFLRIIPDIKVIISKISTFADRTNVINVELLLNNLCDDVFSLQIMALVASTLVDLVKNLRAFAGILVVSAIGIFTRGLL